MKLSTKGRYGVRSMVDLAVHSKDEPVPLYSIAERQNISIIYLEQIFSALRKSSLVKSIKGAQGGYLLASKTEKITVGAILRILEGDLSIVDTIEEDVKSNSIRNCIRVHVWDPMNTCLSNLFDSITLEDLVIEYKQNNGLSGYMYHI